MLSRLINLFIVFTICLLFASTGFGREAGRIYYDLGVFAYEDGDYVEAEKNLKKAFAADPKNPFYNHYLGRTYIKMERFNEAIIHLSKAWDVNPEISGLDYDIAYVNYKMGNYSKSFLLFQKTAKNEPTNVLAIYYAGISLYQEQKYKEALEFLLKASEASPSIKANGYYYAGICYKELGDLNKALEKLKYTRDNTTSAPLME